jgi:hypothetical protein
MKGDEHMPERELKYQLLDRFGCLKDLAAAYLKRLDNAVDDGKITAEEKEVRENAFLEVMKMTLRVFSRESQHALGLEGCPTNWIQCSDGSCVSSAEDCIEGPTQPI